VFLENRSPHNAAIALSFQSIISQSIMKTYQIATIPGDGIGKEVIPAGQQVMEALAKVRILQVRI
jgi:isocitrate dehydrogenase